MEEEATQAFGPRAGGQAETRAEEQPRAHSDRVLALMLLAVGLMEALVAARSPRIAPAGFAATALVDLALAGALFRGVPRAREAVIVRAIIAALGWIAYFLGDQNDAGMIIQVLLCGGLFLAATARRFQNRAFAATGMVAAGVLSGLLVIFNPGAFGEMLPQNRTEEVWLRRGYTALQKGDMKSALINFQQAAALSPGSGSAHNGIGMVYYNLENPQAALAEFAEARRLAPEDPQIASNQGAVLMQMGRDEEALAELSQAIRLKPDGYENYALRGVLYQRQQQYAAARADWEAALRVAPAGTDTSSVKKWLAELP